MSLFYIKRNDTLPILDVSLLTPSGAAYDLTTATGVRLVIRLVSGTTITKAMTIPAPATAGLVRYTWVPSDWNDIPAGAHKMVYEVTLPAGVQTFPTSGYDNLMVQEDLE